MIKPDDFPQLRDETRRNNGISPGTEEEEKNTMDSLLGGHSRSHGRRPTTPGGKAGAKKREKRKDMDTATQRRTEEPERMPKTFGLVNQIASSYGWPERQVDRGGLPKNGEQALDANGLQARGRRRTIRANEQEKNRVVVVDGSRSR